MRLARANHRNYNPATIMSETVAIAIETSCRAGGVALGIGDRLIEAVAFDASRRHAAQLICQLDALLTGAGITPGQLSHVYVSAGPGGFTGLRVGMTVARTLAQFVPGLQCVAVPTLAAVSENVADQPWDDLGVVLDAGDGTVYAAAYHRNGEGRSETTPPGPMTRDNFLAVTARPILLIGEGLWYHELSGEGIELADEALRLPTAEGVWRVGRRMAEAGQVTDPDHMLPIYARPPEAVRLWRQRQQDPNNPNT